MAIAAFFIGHWLLCVFFQTFFQHRYGAHKQFTMSKRWERFFHLVTYLAQGSSFLDPRGYAILHRMHHAYSDGPKDPHSPQNHAGLFSMMWATKTTYEDITYRRVEPEARFAKDVPEWPTLDRFAKTKVSLVLWLGLYTAFYVAFATHWWMYLLLPFHFMMGPIHGSIVNWCGHRYGYRNFESKDVSRNTLVFDFLTLGELFQNNHHHHAMRPNFGARWFEIDPTYFVIRTLALAGVIRLRGGDVATEDEQIPMATES